MLKIKICDKALKDKPEKYQQFGSSHHPKDDDTSHFPKFLKIFVSLVIISVIGVIFSVPSEVNTKSKT